MRYIPRILDPLVRDTLRSAAVVLIEGPRAAGKTNSAERAAASAVHLDRDDTTRHALEVDPDLILSGPSPRLIDEWHLGGTWLRDHIQTTLHMESKPGRFILTSSALPAADESHPPGASRLFVRPLTLVESSESTGGMSLRALLAGERPTAPALAASPLYLAELIVRGGWPLNLELTPSEAEEANRHYLRTVAEADLPQIAGSRRDPARVMRFIRALARNTAMEHVMAKLTADASGPDATLTRPTAYEYEDALTRLMILEVQPAWSTHLRSRARQRGRARTHLVDPSLAAAALEATPATLARDLPTLSRLFQSLALRDLRVYADAAHASVHHYRDSDGLDVDVIVESLDGTWGAFQVRLGPGQVDRAAESLLRFAAKVDTARVGEPAVLGVITASGYGYTRPDGVVSLPIGALGP